ncbi:Cytochrome P450 [Neofusicoccum parvum]|uniref:Cytochrome P450 n=1 Tax=Neofusicoccum parvum TaxID=310453 RepID=A0ACB5SKM0_9PEZI|nr:Cytochrome P450 [Neofusicoccum parvum]
MANHMARCRGGTQLLYLITAIAVLPRAYDGVDLQGQASAVVVIDTDGRFLASRLAQVARGHISSCIQHHATGATGRPDEQQPSITAAHVDSLIAASLAHVHVLQPQSQAALLATLRALPAYLFSPTSHHSAHRPLHSILLDSASAFFWPTRAQEDESRTTNIGTAAAPRANHLPGADTTASDAYAALSRELHALQKRFGCAVIATTVSVPSKTSSHNAGPHSSSLPTLRPLLPASWTGSFPALRLAVARDAVQPFAPAMSVQEAVRERAQRQEVVQRGKGSVWVDGWGSDAWGARLRDAYKDGVYEITTSRKSKTIVIAPKFLEELRRLPDDVLCNYCAVDETIETQYTKVNSHEPLNMHILNTILTPSLRRLTPQITAAVDSAVRAALAPKTPRTDSTTETARLNVTTALLRIVAAVTAFISLGPDLSQDPRFLDVYADYASAVLEATTAATRVPLWARWAVAPWVGAVRRLARRRREAHEVLRGVVEGRRRRWVDGDGEKPDDLLQWTMDKADGFGVWEDSGVVRAHLGVVFAAVHTTTLSATNALYSLAALPDFLPELRSEITDALARHDGAMTFAALQDMKKLDSFLKESMRLHPTQMAMMQRKVLQPFALSSGTTIPAGVVVEVPSIAVSLDPAVFADPLRFDPLRFHRLRAADPASGHLFASVSDVSLGFGYGRHACPGRFFAANEIKMVVARVVAGWDVAMPVGAGEAAGEREEGWARWRNVEVGNFCFPDPTRELLFRKVEV